MRKNFLDNYVDQMTDYMILKYPDRDVEEIRKFVMGKSKEKLEDNIEVSINNNFTKETIETTALELSDYILSSDEKPILTAYGSLFRQHSDIISLNAEFIKFLKAKRKESKKLMFNYMNEGNMVLFAFFDRMQKAYKRLNNSFYGCCAEASSFFFNPLLPPSITYQGFSIITTSIMAFEMLLANNYKIKSFDELITYITRCIKKDNVIKVIDKENIKNRQEVFNYIGKLIDFEITPSEKKILNQILINNKNKMNNIYFTNNLYEFFSNSKPKKLLGKLLKGETILNYSKVSEETNAIMDELYALIKNYISYEYQIFNRANTVSNMTRKAVLGSDTDSNFISLDMFYNWVKENFDLNPEYDKDPEEYCTIANVIISQLARYIQDQFNILTGNGNLEPEYQPIINMKSEFLFPRMLFTRNKKHYSSIVCEQEGNIITPAKLDIKGMPIKKATVNKRTKEVFTNLIHDDILKSKDIDIVKILDCYSNLEKEIVGSLNNGDITFCKPDRVNDINSYKLPYQVQAVRGMIAWNAIYPNEAITTPNKVNILKLKECSYDELKDFINDKNLLKIIKNSIFDNVEMSKYGMSVIALPKNLEKIPDWIKPLIDINSIVNDNLSPGTVILQSLGFKIMEYNAKEYYSSFIEL